MKFGASIGQLMTMCGSMAAEKGWHDKHRSFGEVVALCHSELSEAFEEYRAGRAIHETYYRVDDSGIPRKPEGVPTELADVLIRIFDYCWKENINLEKALVEKMEYNATRPYRHGNKVA